MNSLLPFTTGHNKNAELSADPFVVRVYASAYRTLRGTHLDRKMISYRSMVRPFGPLSLLRHSIMADFFLIPILLPFPHNLSTSVLKTLNDLAFTAFCGKEFHRYWPVLLAGIVNSNMGEVLTDMGPLRQTK